MTTSIKRLNMLVHCAMNGSDPGPLTPEEADDLAAIKAEVDANPGVAFCGVFDA